MIDRFRSSRAALGLALALSLLTGCSAEEADAPEPTPEPDPEPDPAPCAEGARGIDEAGVDTWLCTRFFEEPPLVRAPADGDGVYYGSLDSTGAFITRDGAVHPLFEADGVRTAACGMEFEGPSPGCASALWAPTQRVGVRRNYVLWELRATPIEGGAGLAASSIRPFVVGTAEALAPLLERPFEADGSERKVPFPSEEFFSFDPDRRVRMRLEPRRRGPAEPLQIGAEEGSAEQVTIPVIFEITNATVAVRAADGSCLPSLASLGPVNPFDTGTTFELSMSRYVNMHGPGDDHVVMAAAGEGAATDTGIGVALGGSMDDGGVLPRAVLAPWRWLDAALAIEDDLAMEQTLHGTPNGFSLRLRPAGPAVGGDCP